jgi:DNA polymerase-3 subunit gamma/tau
MDIINDCDIHYRTSKHQRLLVELTLMKIASIPYNEKEGEKKKFRLKPFRSRSSVTNPSNSSTTTSANELKTASNNASQIVAPTPASPSSSQNPNTDKQVTVTTSLFGNQELLKKAGLIRSVKQDIAPAKKDQNQSVEEDPQEVASRQYSIEEIQLAWNRFTNEKLASSMQIQTAFKVAQLELQANDLLRVCVPSETQSMYFNEQRGALGEFMRNEYDIRGIKFEIHILKANEIKSSYKTEKQNFQELVAQNPAIDLLRQKLGLQIDF